MAVCGDVVGTSISDALSKLSKEKASHLCCRTFFVDCIILCSVNSLSVSFLLAMLSGQACYAIYTFSLYFSVDVHDEYLAKHQVRDKKRDAFCLDIYFFFF